MGLIASPPPAPPSTSCFSLSVPRDPSLPTPPTPLAYADIYVDNFVGAAQRSLARTGGLDNCRRVRRLLLHAVDDVFRPLSCGDDLGRREPVSIKKLAAGDCSWGTMKQVLGWIIDSIFHRHDHCATPASDRRQNAFSLSWTLSHLPRGGLARHDGMRRSVDSG
ncbi:hypothetical protein ACHAXA_009010 [Cyclostephanos tholiformis]|uniref:Uncharacterized protein n=1 Tax=Cyclostephanos tholiformis TaxID=382380 RepID=A0ABD3R6J2_9STRA